MPIPALSGIAGKVFGNSGTLGKAGAFGQMGGAALGGAASSGGLSALTNGAAASTGNTLQSIGSGDVNATQASLGSAVADAQAMTEMQMQASSAMAKMNMMASINDGLNSVMKKAGESFKSAAQ